MIFKVSITKTKCLRKQENKKEYNQYVDSLR